MPEPYHQVSAGRASAACALMLAIAAGFQFVSGDVSHDEASFGAGYAAVSNRALVRSAMGVPGATPAAFCVRLYETDTLTRGVVRDDFLDGCSRAVGDAME
jgi:hypothetical protein